VILRRRASTFPKDSRILNRKISLRVCSSSDACSASARSRKKLRKRCRSVGDPEDSILFHRTRLAYRFTDVRMLRKARAGFPGGPTATCKISCRSYARTLFVDEEAALRPPGISRGSVRAPIAQWTRGRHYDNIRRATRGGERVRDDGWPLRPDTLVIPGPALSPG